jgi:ligand-binding sensor domain-containing protein
LFEDSGGRLWLGTWSGLACLSGDELRTFGRAEGVLGKRVWSVAEDLQARLWVVSSRGLCVLKEGGQGSIRAPDPIAG